MAAGMGNWDEFVRTGGWDVGARLPTALGVEAADRVATTVPFGPTMTASFGST